MPSPRRAHTACCHRVGQRPMNSLAGRARESSLGARAPADPHARFSTHRMCCSRGQWIFSGATPCPFPLIPCHHRLFQSTVSVYLMRHGKVLPPCLTRSCSADPSQTHRHLYLYLQNGLQGRDPCTCDVSHYRNTQGRDMPKEGSSRDGSMHGGVVGRRSRHGGPGRR